MAVGRAGHPRSYQRLRSDLRELRAEVLSHAFWAALGFAAFIYWMLAVSHREPRPSTTDYSLYFLAIAGAIVLVVFLARWARGYVGPVFASLALIGGLGLVVVITFLVGHDERVLYWFAVLIILSSGTLGGRVAIATAGLTCLTLAAAAGPLAILPQDVATTAGVFMLAVAVASWLALQPTYTALEWALSSYSRARETTERLRDRQAELIRTTERLQWTNERLEHLNQELVRARETAEEARRLKAQFAATVSHELRTPLMHIIGFADLIINAPESFSEPLPPSYQSSVEAIHRAATHLSKLIDDILDLSQIEAARMGLVKEKVALADIIQEAADMVSSVFRAKRLNLSLDLEPDAPPVYVDRTRVRQVIINLLANAARFTDKGGVTVSSRLGGSELLVSITDTGIGISAEDLPSVFEEFRQVDGSPSRRYGGSGLGLAICKRFIELHAGRIWVTSEPGSGTTFTFSLPLSTKGTLEVMSPGGLPTHQPGANGGRPDKVVVVIGDDPAVPRLLQRYSEGLQVLGATGYDQFGHLQEERNVDAVIVAATSAEDAWHSVSRLRGSLGGIPIVACSLPHKRGGPRDGGFAGWISKPVSRARLHQQLGQLRKKVKRVLVVDDDPDTVQLMVRMVHSVVGRCRVSTAATGEDALNSLRRQVPDVVLLDLTLPGIDGYGVLQRMRNDERLKSVPVVGITGHDDPEESIVADAVVVTRGGGLAAGELIPCLDATLSTLFDTPGGVREPLGTFGG